MKKFLTLIFAFILVLSFAGCTSEKVDSDAIKFKKEYESLNGEKNDNGKAYRELNISSNNPFIYATAEEISNKIANRETFIVYFGFKECPWCRSVLEELIHAASDSDVDVIYYVDVTGIRDVKSFDDNGKIVTTNEGDEYYLKLLEQLADVLDEYTLKVDEEEIEVGEKRIYAPNVVAVSSGKAIQLETGISEELTDPYGELTDSIQKYSYNKFKCLMECLEEESISCQKNKC